MTSIIEQLVTVPFTLRPGLKPIIGPNFTRTAFNLPDETLSEPIGSALGRLALHEALSSYLLTHRLVKNDLAWLTYDGVIEALRVDNPSGWEPSEKLGMSFAELHKPLPPSATVLKQAFPSVLKLVNRQWYERSVWTLSPNPHLDQRPSKRAVYVAQGEGWQGEHSEPCFRYELQQIGPMSGGILFTIDVRVIPLSKLDKESILLIKQALESMPYDVREYKGLVDAIL